MHQQGASAAAAAPANNTAAAAAEAKSLAEQGSWLWLLKRWLILHSDLLVGVTCFAAAMQAPSAVGLAVLCGTLIRGVQCSSATPHLARIHTAHRGTPSSSSSSRAEVPPGIFSQGCLMALQLLVSAWLLLQYMLQVQWLRSLLLEPAPPLLPWLLMWLGLPLSGDDPAAAQVQGLGLEVMLRYKALILVAVAVRSKAKQWQQLLPDVVVGAAAVNRPCPLFWPPMCDAAGAAAGPQQPVGVQVGGGSFRPDNQAGAAAVRPDKQAAASGSWEDIEPVLRRAEQLMTPLTALVFKVKHG